MPTPVFYNFPLRGAEDNRGYLVAVEGGKEIPFDIKRVYYIFGTKPRVTRGEHAHKTLRQILIAVSGQCRLVLDDGKEKTEVWLSRPEQGLFVDRMVWREMTDFSSDCVLLVLADQQYDADDYIRNYKVFREMISDTQEEERK